MTMKKAPQSRVLKSGEVRWRIYYRHDGKQRSKSFEDYESAERWSKLIDKVGIAEALSILPSWEGDVQTPQTLEKFALEHIDLLTGVGDDYRSRCRRVIRNDLGIMGQLPVESITEDLISLWVTSMEAAGLTGKTIKNKHGLLGAVFKRALRKKIITVNPCEGTHIPRSVTEEMIMLTDAEFASFLDYITPHWQPIVAFLFGSGVRFSEATALTVGDIDTVNLRVSITKAWKNGGKTLGPPKTRRGRRSVSISKETLDAILPLIVDRAPDELLFTNQRGTRVSHQTFHENVWQPAVRLANGEPAQAAGAKRVARRLDAAGRVIAPSAVPLGKRPRIHDARHTHASWLLHQGVPINYVQAQLGHESITTTVDRYGHLVPGASAALSAALSNAMSQALPEIED